MESTVGTVATASAHQRPTVPLPRRGLRRSATATPMSYTFKGRQYVLINAGGHAMYNRGTGDCLIAFALPEAQ